MVTQRDAETTTSWLRDAVPARRPRRCANVAHPQIRSRGTVGGSVAHADPAAELPAVVVALDARGARPRARRASGRSPAAELYSRLADDRARAGRDPHRGRVPGRRPQARVGLRRGRPARRRLRAVRRASPRSPSTAVVRRRAPGPVRRRRPAGARRGRRRTCCAEARPRAEAIAAAAGLRRGRRRADPQMPGREDYSRHLAAVVARRGPWKPRSRGRGMSTHRITVTVNGVERTEKVEARLTLADFLRERLDLTATHLGCEHGVCGACTVLDRRAHGALLPDARRPGRRRRDHDRSRASRAGRASCTRSSRASGRSTACSAASARRES